ncbi:hypothetical protein ACIBG0_41845 [Nocardia sp. NPDC050630]
MRLKRLPWLTMDNVKAAAVIISAAASLVNVVWTVYRVVSALQESGWF